MESQAEMKKIIKFFDKLEDKVRGWMSHRPIIYGIVGGVGVVLFWRGVWHTADFLYAFYATGGTSDAINAWDGPVSFLAGLVIVLITGLLVSNFIGNEIILSGLRGEKKLVEKTEVEVKTETGAIARIQEDLKVVLKRLDDIEKKVK